MHECCGTSDQAPIDTAYECDCTADDTGRDHSGPTSSADDAAHAEDGSHCDHGDAVAESAPQTGVRDAETLAPAAPSSAFSLPPDPFQEQTVSTMAGSAAPMPTDGEPVNLFPLAHTLRMTLAIEDLGCGGALIVERALMRTPGVARVYVNPATEMAYIEFDQSATDISTIIAAIEHAGFHAGHPTLR